MGTIELAALILFLLIGIACLIGQIGTFMNDDPPQGGYKDGWK